MVMVSAIALMADVSVGRQCQLLIQHEGEDTAVWESMSIALPSVAPPTTAQHRALSARHAQQVTRRDTQYSHHSCRQGRRADDVKLAVLPSTPLDQVVLNVMLCRVLMAL